MRPETDHSCHSPSAVPRDKIEASNRLADRKNVMESGSMLRGFDLDSSSQDEPKPDTDQTPQGDARNDDEEQCPTPRPLGLTDIFGTDGMNLRRCRISACGIGVQSRHDRRHMVEESSVDTRVNH